MLDPCIVEIEHGRYTEGIAVFPAEAVMTDPEKVGKTLQGMLFAEMVMDDVPHDIQIPRDPRIGGSGHIVFT